MHFKRKERRPQLHLFVLDHGVLRCSCGATTQLTETDNVYEYIRQHCLIKNEPAILLRETTKEE